MFLLRQQKHWFGALALVFAINFLLVPSLSFTLVEVLVFAGINIILAVSLNLVNGVTGQFSIGHAGFMAVGAYTSAWLTFYCRDNFGLNFAEPGAVEMMALVATIVGGAFLSAGIGYVVGLPSLRLKGDYLAIVTLGFGEIIRVSVLNIEALGGARGYSGIPKLVDFLWVYLFVVFTLFIISRLVRSARGRAFLAVREDEIAAENMGVNITQTKVHAFTYGAFFAGIAGGLYAHYLTVLSPSAFDFNRSFEVIIMVVLGGMGSISGSVFAAVLLTFLKEYLRDLNDYTGVDLRMVIYAAILILLMLTRPGGLFGHREMSQVWRDWRRRKAQA